MKNSHRKLLNQMESFDNYDGAENNLIEGGEGSGRNRSVGAMAGGILGNPVFKAQFNLRISNVYYDETGAAVILPAALPAALQVQNPVYIFGNSDFAGAYAKGKQLVPFVNGGAGFWNFLELGILGRDTLAVAATQYPTALEGDMLFISQGTVAANVYTRICIVHCPQVAYATLLDSIQSDRFVLNMIRYVVDPTLTTQLSNQIKLLRQSLFGKTSDDTIDPQTYITGNTFQSNIADIPLEIGVDKNLVLGTQILFNVQDINWIVTVFSTKKLTEPV